VKVRVLRSALEDLAAGRRFYDRQGHGLGDYFFDSLFAEIDSLTLYGGIHPVSTVRISSAARQAFSLRVYYRIIGGEAVVFRVLDCRRDPAWVRRKLKESAER
jgi:hypothetical protein